ncbi:hypothetical protein H2204_003396 [Knufia peltigerae]|uniref:Uncharacterized protein n=1 Tax=Knufia peltigerae TaxID=1002370 RepID=A0AA38Y9A3_9EURO|nr:hypothetical protein H2204_003396 [Knufia peltigerae]
MSHNNNNDDYAPRSRRDRPRYDQDAAPLRYPEDNDYHPDTRKSGGGGGGGGGGSRRPRYEQSPPPYTSEDSRRRKDLDPRDTDKRKNKYRDYPGERDDDLKPTKSNTAAPRRHSPLVDNNNDDDDGDRDSGTRRHRGGADPDAGYGRSRGYRAPLPRHDSYASDGDDPKMMRSSKPSRRRDDPYADDFEPAPPRRAHTHREPDRKHRDDPYHDDPHPPRRRYRSPAAAEDRHSDPDRSYARRRRDDDQYDDRRYRGGGGGGGGHSRRDDGYASDRGYKRSDRDKGKDRYYRDRDRDRERDRDRDRDRRRYDSRDRSRDRDGRTGKKKGFSFDDIGGLVEQGQKHYKTVAPLVTSIAKMYLDNKK